MARQLSLNLKTWGGSRKGAGRKPNGAKAGVSHLRRPKVTRHTPVHVTLRLGAGLPNLRRGELTKVVVAALAAGKKAPGFALVHYSLQSNHLHLMIEADSSATLARGMKSLSIRVARAINRWRGDKGKVFADRYHVHVLATPRETRLSLAYLLNNFRKHNVADSKTPLDPCSSAASFDGWKQRSAGFAATASQAEGVVAAKSWMLTTGWRRHGLIDPYEVPSCDGSSHAATKRRLAKKKDKGYLREAKAAPIGRRPAPGAS